MFCDKCGNVIDPNVNFCDKCGNRVQAPAMYYYPQAPAKSAATTVFFLFTLITTILMIILLLAQKWIDINISMILFRLNDNYSLFQVFGLLENYGDIFGEVPAGAYIAVLIPVIISIVAVVLYVIHIVMLFVKKRSAVFSIIASGLYIISFLYVLIGTLILNEVIREELGRFASSPISICGVLVFTMIIAIVNIVFTALYSANKKKSGMM